MFTSRKGMRNSKSSPAQRLAHAILKDGIVYVRAGGGLAADSDPEAEFQETGNSEKALMGSAKEALEQSVELPRIFRAGCESEMKSAGRGADANCIHEPVRPRQGISRHFHSHDPR